MRLSGRFFQRAAVESLIFFRGKSPPNSLNLFYVASQIERPLISWLNLHQNFVCSKDRCTLFFALSTELCLQAKVFWGTTANEFKTLIALHWFFNGMASASFYRFWKIFKMLRISILTIIGFVCFDAVFWNSKEGLWPQPDKMGMHLDFFSLLTRRKCHWEAKFIRNFSANLKFFPCYGCSRT